MSWWCHLLAFGPLCVPTCGGVHCLAAERWGVRTKLKGNNFLHVRKHIKSLIIRADWWITSLIVRAPFATGSHAEQAAVCIVGIEIRVFEREGPT